MKALPLLVLAAILFALPAPDHHFSARIQADGLASFRISLAYRVRFGTWLDLGFRSDLAG